MTQLKYKSTQKNKPIIASCRSRLSTCDCDCLCAARSSSASSIWKSSSVWPTLWYRHSLHHICCINNEKTAMCHQPQLTEVTYQTLWDACKTNSTQYVKPTASKKWMELLLILSSPSPPVDFIWALMIVQRIRGKIIKTDLCCVSDVVPWWNKIISDPSRYRRSTVLKLF